MTLADSLQALLDSRGHTAYRAAKVTGLGYATIHGLLAGKRTNPSRETLQTISEAYGVSIDSLLPQDGGGPESGAGVVREPGPKTYPPTADAKELEADTDEEVIDLGRRLDAIENSDLTEVLKIVKIEALSAAVRADQARIEARAAVIRARAIERAEGSAESRARAIERAEESARGRSLALTSELSLDQSDAALAARVLRGFDLIRGIMPEADEVRRTETEEPDERPKEGGRD